MFQGLRCFLGRHNWVRIGSAPAELLLTDSWNKVYSKKDCTFVPSTRVVHGFVLLVECRFCPKEKGYGEYGGKKQKRTPAYARAFIEGSPDGRLTRED